MDDQDIFEKSITLRTSLRLGLRRARRVTACSQFALNDAIGRFGVERGRECVIFNGVALPGPECVPGPVGEECTVERSSARWLLGVGRLVEKKGFDLLIEAFSKIADRHLDVVVVIAGDGPTRKDLESLAVKHGLEDRVRFPGRLDSGQVARAMGRAEALVVPSRIEPFGIVVLEAWRGTTAVVATNRGGTREFVRDGVDGVLVDPFDTDMLAATLDKVLSSQRLRHQLATAGRQRVEEFGWSTMADRYRSLYLQVAAAPKSPGSDPGAWRGRTRKRCLDGRARAEREHRSDRAI